MSTVSPADTGGAGHVAVEPFRASALAASLTVRDLRTSLAWYRDVVGFTVDRQYKGQLSSVAVSAGDVGILRDPGGYRWAITSGR